MAETQDLSFLAELEIEPTEMAVTSRGRKSEFNPMEAHYMKSYMGDRETRNYRDRTGQTRITWYGPAFQIKVKANAAHMVERLLRRASNDTPDGGCSVQFFLSPDSDDRIVIDQLPGVKPRAGKEDIEKVNPNRNVWVAFQAKERILKPRNGDTPDAADEEDYEETDAA